MAKVVITLDKIRHFAPMSEETHCFTATLLVNGKRVGTVSNEGHGGCDLVHFDKGCEWDHMSLEKAVKESYPPVDISDIAPGEPPSWRRTWSDNRRCRGASKGSPVAGAITVIGPCALPVAA